MFKVARVIVQVDVEGKNCGPECRFKTKTPNTKRDFCLLFNEVIESERSCLCKRLVRGDK